MKRIFIFTLALCLLLCACSSSETPTVTTEPTTEPTEATTVPTEPATEPTTEPTEATTVPTEPPVIYRNPLNGSVLSEPYTGRATAVVINNISAALPQYGLAYADMVFELEVEGDITRLLAIYTQLDGVGNIGPVRSSRSFFNNISAAYDSPIIHCGGSRWGINGYYDEYNKIPDWAHINEQYNGSYFFRDMVRAETYSWEHTLFTSSDLLLKGLADKEFNTTTPEGVDYGLIFEDDVTLDGETANVVTINFRFGKTTTMTYNPDNDLYAAYQYNRNHIEGSSGEVISYRNVLCLYTSQWQVYDGTYNRSFYSLIGEGNGHFACGGKIIPIKWSRADLNSPFIYTMEDGTPLTLAAGTTYVGICSNKMTVNYE